MVGALVRLLQDHDPDVVCCHGYKADIVGLLAARRTGVPVIAMSHGWTAETWKVRAYEALDRACLRRMDRVVCVSAGQAEKVRRAGVRADRVTVIRGRMDVGAQEGFHTHASDIVVVHLSGGDIEDTADGKTRVNHWKHGDVEFEARGSSHSARNLGPAVEAVLVTLKP